MICIQKVLIYQSILNLNLKLKGTIQQTLPRYTHTLYNNILNIINSQKCTINILIKL